eukprot:15443715-Alexandrium_andersonii.AAC.1
MPMRPRALTYARLAINNILANLGSSAESLGPSNEEVGQQQLCHERRGAQLGIVVDGIICLPR